LAIASVDFPYSLVAFAIAFAFSCSLFVWSSTLGVSEIALFNS